MNPLGTLQQMLVILVIIAVGYAAYKTRMISENSLKSISKLTADVFNPAIIFSSMVVNTGGKRPGFAGGIFLLAALMFGASILIGWLFSCLLTKKKAVRSVFELMFVFSNMGFIGIPVVSSLFGQEYVFYVAIYIFEYNVLFYTMGIHIIDRIAEGRSSGSEAVIKSSLWQKIRPMINMGTIACVAALVVFAFRIPVPKAIGSSVTYLGNAAIPVSLIVIGCNVASQPDLLSIFKDCLAYKFALLKMFALPAICTLILKFLPVPETIRQLSMIMMAMPVGTMPLVVLTEKGIESKEYSDSIILTSVLSVVTLPVMAGIYQLIMSL